MLRHFQATTFCLAVCMSVASCQMDMQMDMDQMSNMMAPNSQAASSPAVAMEAMMQSTDAAMMAVPACDSTDIYFARMMIPHHQGAIEMAEWYQQNGEDSELLNISSNIISSQEQEIAQLQSILSTMSIPAQCMPSPAPSMDMRANAPGMMSSGAASSPGAMALEESMNMMMAPTPTMPMENADMAFTETMRMHHMAAVDMANVEILYGYDPNLINLAETIIAEQSAQIGQFDTILADMPATF